MENNFPVFVFSASWRTGSTLVQRLINATGKIMIWGEPQFLFPLCRTRKNQTEYFKSALWIHKAIANEGIEKAWTPIYSPEPEYVDKAYKAFFDTLYAEPARAMGFQRWGFKEVREHAVEIALWLKKMYPNAKFVFHYRHPYDMYESVTKSDFFSNFEDPMMPVKTWRNNVKSFYNKSRTNELNHIIITHEELTGTDSHEHLKNLFNFIELGECIEKSFSALEKKVGFSKGKVPLESALKSRIDEILAEDEITSRFIR